MSPEHDVTKENQPRIYTAGLIVSIEYIARAFVDSHSSDVRPTPQGFLQPHDRIICVRIRAARPRVHFHQPQRQPPDRTGHFGPAVDRHLLTGYRIDADLAAEKQLVNSSQTEIEDSSILQEKL